MTSQRIRQIISGEATDWTAAVLRGVLGGAAGLYRGAVVLRNLRYDRGRAVRKLSVPVISVGNITAGGTGKTPMVAWLAQHAQQLGREPAILSRGYGHSEGWNDENRLLHELLPRVPLIVNRNRVAGGQDAIESHHARLLILDDGFQHRRLARDLDIVLIDATCPFGYGHVLPRGLLREPLSGLRRADLVVITRSDMVTAERLDRIKADIRAAAAREIPLLPAVHQPVDLADAAGVARPLDELHGSRVLAFCSIGNPGAFARQLKALGARVRLCAFGDHANYDAARLEQVRQRAAQWQASYAVTTEKDWMKLKELPEARQWSGLRRLRIRLAFTEGSDILLDRIKQL